MSVGAPGAEAGRAGRGRATSGRGCWTRSQDQRPPRGCLSGREEPSGRCAGEAVQCSGGGRASAQTCRWPRAGRPSGSLGRPIWQRDAAVVPWPRPPRECAPGRGPASTAPDGGDASGKRPLAGAASDGSPHPADTCGADCTRKRAEQSLQAAIRTLRKSISRQQFSVQVADTEYEVAQRPAKAPEGPGACSTGQVLQDGKCGESLPWPLARRLCPSSHAWPGRQAHQDGAGTQPARGRCHGTCRDGVTQRAPAGPRPWTRLPLSGSSCI